MSFQHFGKGTLRVVKNYTKGYSHTQTKVRDATSNDPWPPSGRVMHDIAQLTYNPEDFIEIMEMVDKRLNDKGKNWRHVFKSLVLLDYLIHSGSENVVRYSKDNIYIIKTLREFQFIDEDGKDQGQNVRQKAKDITNLLTDDNRLKQERRNRQAMYERMRGRRSTGDEWDKRDRSRSATPVQAKRTRMGDEDEELRRAIEESKRIAARDAATAEQRDLERAMKLSEEEERKRAQAVAAAGTNGLFDEQAQRQANAEVPLIDINATLPLQYSSVQPQFTALQPQYTSFVQPQYTSFQPQYTNIQPQLTSVHPQFSSFNPWQQQAEQDMLQAQWMQQQQAQAQAQAQQEEWIRQQQTIQLSQQSPQPIPAQHTSFGSNNPFAGPTPSASAPPRSHDPSSSDGVSFNLTGTYDRRGAAASAPPGPRELQSPQQRSVRTRNGNAYADLANLFAARGEDGVDTFGNTGQLRFMSTEAGRVVAQKTGTSNLFSPSGSLSPIGEQRTGQLI